MKRITFLLCLTLFCAYSISLNAQLHFEQFVFEGYGSPFLDNASSVAVSPDEQHVYVASFDDHGISLLVRDLNTGVLSFVEAYKNGVSGVNGLEGVKSILVSPDGKHVYASGQIESSLVVFGRDLSTGKLTLVEILKDNENGLEGMEGAFRLKSSKDGNFIYLLSPKDDAVQVFKRNVITGVLSSQQLIVDGSSGGNNMTYPLDAVISPNGNYFYVSSFGDKAISIFNRDKLTGELNYIDAVVNGEQNVEGIDGANAIAISPDGKYLMASGEHTLAVFQRASSTGQLNYLAHYTDGVDGDKLDGIEAIGVSENGQYIYTLSALDDAITVFEMNPLNAALTIVDVIENGEAGVSGLDYPTSIVFTNNGTEVYLTSFGGNGLLHFDIDNSTGLMNFNSVMNSNNTTGISGIEGARAIVVSADNQHVYVGGELDDALTMFERDASSGALSYLGMFEDGGANDGLNGVMSVTMSPDDMHVYAGGFWDNSVAFFERDISTGLLTYLGRVKDGLFGTDGLNGVRDVIVSPDGMFVYTAASLENGIGLFSRNASSGMLEYEDVYFDGQAGIDGIDGVVDLAISPNGEHLYAAGKGEDAIAIFERDINTGALTYLENLKDGDPGIDALDGIRSIKLSSDGLHLYTASDNDNAISLFSRDPSTGTLSISGVYIDEGQGGTVEGLVGVSDVALSSDGSYLYACSYLGHAVSAFERDANTGELNQTIVLNNGQGGVNGIGGANAVVVSPNGESIYTAAFNDHAIGIFSCTIEEMLDVTICEGETYTFGGNELSIAGQYEHITDNSGCKTISKLNLVISPANTFLEVEICEGDIYNIENESFDETGSYAYVFTTAEGCDSTINLNLNVVSSFSNTEIVANVCSGESYELGNEVYTSSGIYETTFTTSLGCDSMVTLDLTVLEPIMDTLDVETCVGQFYIFGTSNFIESGEYSQTFSSENGCDSIVTLYLEFVPSNYFLEETICEGEVYMLGDDTITVAGNYEGELFLNNGCEVFVNLELTVLPVGSSIIEASICEGEIYVFNNSPYSQSGFYEAAYPVANGCDSIVTLDLTVYPVDVLLEATICEGDSYEMGGVDYTMSGSYESTLNSNNGCDSMVHLILEVIPTEDNIDAAICQGEVYELGNEVYSETGIFELLIEDPSGCETMVTLNLELLSDIESTVVINNDHGLNDGSIDMTVSGGMEPYTYQWNTGSTQEDLSGLPSGSYEVTITDSEGCTVEYVFEIGFSTSTNQVSDVTMEMELVPNLVEQGGRINLNINSPSVQDGKMRIVDQIGQLIMEENISLQAGENDYSLDVPAIVGIYYVQITYEGGMKSLKFSVSQ